ncbi:hypothetical protein QWY84_11950 [Aquisalimonas lutea]|uniref:hypothetical protein n=1 Tax=Aquisalimonas lutea TaxID=1327750 RepID=UPI0025B408E7|nr:hypothetical protein [Aquisalimonas lutea]MDN3518327.1 hypothetical protein [Aquisalimonas lutea]
MALWRCRVPAGEQMIDAEESGVVVEAESMEEAQTLAKREMEFEEVLVDDQGRTIRFEIKDIVCEPIQDET